MVSYGLAAFAPFPEMLSLILAFAFGPLFMLASYGLYHLIAHSADALVLRIGLLFNLVATAMVTVMLVVQQTIFSFHDRFKAADHADVSEEQLTWMFREVNSVQLGMDIAWDIFISLGTFFFALAMWKHPVFGKILALSGMVIALLLLSFNLAWFPEPPADAGSIDFGPLVALWYLVLTIWIVFRRKAFLAFP
jgi:hypothetical protein